MTFDGVTITFLSSRMSVNPDLILLYNIFPVLYVTKMSLDSKESRSIILKKKFQAKIVFIFFLQISKLLKEYCQLF